MLDQQQSLQFSAYTDLYDKVVPKNHLLRQINDLIDFSFIYEELVSKYCPDNGRRAESPIRLFKYLLLKVISDSSDVDVVERSMYDMSFKYFLGMTPEEDVINPSTLTKFRKLRLQDTNLLNMLIGKTVNLAIEKGIIKSNTIIVDATHSIARSNPHSSERLLRVRVQQLREAISKQDASFEKELPASRKSDELESLLVEAQEIINSVDANQIIPHIPSVRERLNVLKETIDDIKDHRVTSVDKDARLGHKDRHKWFFGYKTHIAMTPERIISSAVVTSGEKSDGKQLPDLVDQSRRNGIAVDTVIGDTAYSGDANLKKAKEEGYRIVSKLNPVISQGAKSEAEQWDYNKDAGMYVCPAGHLAIRKAKIGKKESQHNQTQTYYFDVENCKTCSLREGCYKEGRKSKTYSISILRNTQQDQKTFQESEEFRELYKERYKIEAKNAELKHVFGYERAESYGIDSMQMQGAITMFVANLKRIIKLLGEAK